ncbi:MAG: S8 family serine peptidase [Anaerolineales bacterium]
MTQQSSTHLPDDRPPRRDDDIPRQRVYRYGFMPRQVQVTFFHPPGLSSGDLSRIVASFLGTLNGERTIFRQAGATLTFESEAGGATFSTVLLQIDSPMEYPHEQLGLIKDINRRLRAALPPNVDRVAAEPNWLIGSAQNGQGSGGPGTRPISAPPPPPTTHQTQPIMERMAKYQAYISQRSGASRLVTVAILDTAPPWLVFTTSAGKPGWNTHAIMQPMLTPTPHTINPAAPALPAVNRNPNDEPFRVFYGMRPPAAPDDGYFPCGHDYPMTDHGLFVASLVRMIAPEAKLELYQVLGEKGVGNLFDLATVLQALYRRRMSGQDADYLIINLSMMVLAPYYRDPLWPELVRRYEGDTATEETAFAAFRAVCAALAALSGVVIVAAAGNEADKPHQGEEVDCETRPGCLAGLWSLLSRLFSGRTRPEPQYPAAFTEVIGVASIGQSGAPAIYSNISDTLSGQLTARVVAERGGYIAFGGEAGNLGELGMYIGTLPGGATPNDSGWAYWGGTSFAAPKISGLAAVLLGTGAAADVTDLTEKLSQIDPSGYTPDGEQIVAL